MPNNLQLEITGINKEYKDTLCLTLREKDDRIKEFLPGQFLTLIFNINGEEVRRGFSISSSPNELPNIELAIKKIDEGVTSKYLYEELELGDVIESLPPLGNFTVQTQPNEKRYFVMIGAGSGITPLYSMIKTILSDEPDSKIKLLYGNRYEDAIIYKKELDVLAEHFRGKIKVDYYLSQPNKNWSGLTGRIEKEHILELLENENIKSNANFYLCGPEGMMKTAIDTLKENGVVRKRIHREIYHTSVIDQGEEIEEKVRDVTIILNGDKHIVTVPPDVSIMQAAFEAGLEIPNSCQYGNCGTCKAKHLSGKLKLVDQTALTEEEIEHGYCLTCVGYPASDNVVILYENQFE